MQHVLLLESRQRGYDDVSYRSNFKNKLEKKKTIIQLTLVGNPVFELRSFTDASLNKTDNSRSYILLNYTQESCINFLTEFMGFLLII